MGTLIVLRLSLAPTWNARLRLWVEGHEESLSGARNAAGLMEFSFHAPMCTGLIWYYFLIDTPEGVCFYGAHSGEGQLAPTVQPSWQITVYEPDYDTPAWFCEGIAYQILPDRFYKEDRGGLDRAQSHLAMGRQVYLHEGWEEAVLYAPLPGQEYYDPCDFYGGDLDGIREKLPYLKSLGVGCIYLNPIFESPSNHRYNVSDYLRVDPMLGDAAALAALVEAAKDQDMRIMLDGVFSHTGADSVYFDRFGRYGQGAYAHRDSPYFEWYDFTDYPDAYRCWWGFKSLPEIRELTPSYMDFIAQVLAHYARLGLTSWRLDVADELPDAFIAFLRDKLKALDKEGVLLGEVWEDASNKEGFGDRRRYVDGHELDSAMNYPLRDALCGFLLGYFDASTLCGKLLAQRENYPPPFYQAQLNLLGSHDTVRIATVLSEAPHRDALPREAQSSFTPSPAAAARGRARLRLAVLLQMTLPGVPCIYYGDEAGCIGMADPFCRGTYPWGKEDASLLTFYQCVTALRASRPALRHGLCGICAPSPEVVVVLRQSGADSCLAIVNRREMPQDIVLRAADFTEGPDAPLLCLAPCYQDALTGRFCSPIEGVLPLRLPGFGTMLFCSCDEGL